jgi:hypothetical protein
MSIIAEATEMGLERLRPNIKNCGRVSLGWAAAGLCMRSVLVTLLDASATRVTLRDEW